MPEISIPPGIVKTLSGAAAVGRFIDCDKVRFYNGKPEKIGGNRKLTSDAMRGIPRNVCAYLPVSRLEVMIAGTEQRLYAIDFDYTVTNITPYRSTVSLANPFSTTNGSAVVTVTDVDHAALQGDTVHFSGATAVGGITIAGDYIITSIIGVNSYRILHSIAAASTAGPGGGGAVSTKYEISIGTTDTVEGTGYGAGEYGMEDYGTGRTGTAVFLDARFWSLTNYGTLGLFSYQFGTIYTWDQDTQNQAVALSGAPDDCLYVFMTPERFITALQDAMTISWPDRDVPTDWVPTSLNTANSRVLGTGSKLIAGCALDAVSLIWSDTAAYSHQYISGLEVYRTDLIGEAAGLVGPGAFKTMHGIAYWLTNTLTFLMYSGQALPIPKQDNIIAWLVRKLDPNYRFKTISWTVPHQLEMWWGFVSVDSPDGEPDTYVGVSTKDYEWFIGTQRRCGAGQRIANSRLPLLTSTDGYLYEHELPDTTDDDGSPMDWFYEVGLWRIPDAKQSVDIFGFAPDFERQSGDIEFECIAKDRPQSSTEDTETATLTTDTEIQDLRVAGRYFSYRMSQSGVTEGDFREGTHVLDIQGAGERR